MFTIFMLLTTDIARFAEKSSGGCWYNDFSELSQSFAILSRLRLSRPQARRFPGRLPQSISNSFSSDLSGND